MCELLGDARVRLHAGKAVVRIGPRNAHSATMVTKNFARIAAEAGAIDAIIVAVRVNPRDLNLLVT